MGVDTGVPGGSSQILVLPVRNVQVCLGVAILLSESEINHVDLVASLSDTHEEIVGLDVPVNEVSRMNVLDTGDLQDEHK